MITEEQIESFKKITKAVNVSQSMRKLGEYRTYILDFRSKVKWLKERENLIRKTPSILQEKGLQYTCTNSDSIIRGTYIDKNGREGYGWVTTIEEDEMIQIVRDARLKELGI
jgi:hypothetical protein